jgi:hypothetical protein
MYLKAGSALRRQVRSSKTWLTLVEIGITNGAGGFSIVMMQLFIFHRIARKLKMINTFRLGAIICIPVFILVPFVNFTMPVGKGKLSELTNGQGLAWTLVILLYVIRNFASQCGFSSVMALIVNSVEYEHMV